MYICVIVFILTRAHTHTHAHTHHTHTHTCTCTDSARTLPHTFTLSRRPALFALRGGIHWQRRPRMLRASLRVVIIRAYRVVLRAKYHLHGIGVGQRIATIIPEMDRLLYIIQRTKKKGKRALFEYPKIKKIGQFLIFTNILECMLFEEIRFWKLQNCHRVD